MALPGLILEPVAHVIEIPEHPRLLSLLVVQPDDLAYMSPIELVEPEEFDVGPMLEDSGPLVGMPQLRSDPRFAGITGDGFGGSSPIGVAVVDGGIDVDHL